MDFLLRPASLILVMLLAFILRAAGIFTEVETHGVTKVALTITIPAAILCSFENFQRDMQLVWVSAVMLSLVALAVLLSWFLYRKQGNTERIFAMINNGYNTAYLDNPMPWSENPSDVCKLCKQGSTPSHNLHRWNQEQGKVAILSEPYQYVEF